MQDSSRPVIGYPVHNVNGCAPPPPATSATACPYVHPNPYPYYQPPPPQNQRPTFFRLFIIAMAILLFIFGITLLIFWLVLRPHLPDFSIQSLSLSNFNASNQRVTATWNAQFQVSNPNKKLSITYADVVSSVFHKDYFLTETRIVPFSQGTGDVRTLDASFSLADSFVEGKVVDAMNGERTRGEVKFNVGMVADVAFRYSGWRGRRRVLRVWCGDVTLAVSSGRMTGGPKSCLVALTPYHGSLVRKTYRQDDDGYALSSAAAGVPPETMADDCGRHDKQQLTKRVAVAIFGFLIVFAIVVFLVWAILHPTQPHFILQDVTIYAFNLTAPNYLTSNMQITLVSRNPNERIGIYYHKLDVLASYRNQQITLPTLIPRTYQGHQDATVWSPLLYGNAVPVAPFLEVGLNQDMNAGMVLLNVKAFGQLKWKVGTWISGRYQININCPVYISFTGPTKAIQVGVAMKYQLVQSCSVDISLLN
ncbi:hypothetical protein Gotur_016554 [Gossypium turneri]